MKDKFPGHFSTPQSKEDLWQNCIFVFDTNILLNLYRYSDETRTLFIKTLEGLRDRIWIPYRVAAEYLENRLDVIYEQQEEYEKAITDIKKLKGKLENSRQHPFVTSSTMKAVGKSLDNAISELEKNKETHNKRIHDDEIKEFISEIFNERVGDSPVSEDLEKIISEGIERYKQKIPPGYSDIKKQGAEESLTARCRPYGDLIIWKGLLEKAKQDNLPTIFVTDDGKEDWWLRFKGKTLGPRPELIEEFRNTVAQDFYMYLPERFLSMAAEAISENPSKEILDEIRDTRNKEQDQSSAAPQPKRINRTRRFHNIHKINIGENLPPQQGWLNEKIDSLEMELSKIENHLSRLEEAEENIQNLFIKLLNNHSDESVDPYDTEEFMSLRAEHIYLIEEIEALASKKNEISRELSYLYSKAGRH